MITSDSDHPAAVRVGDRPDLIAPGRPALAVRVTPVEHPSPNPDAGPGTSCRGLKTLSFELRDPSGVPLDDQTPDSSLTALVYIGPTPEAADDAATPWIAAGARPHLDYDPELFNAFTFVGGDAVTPYEELCLTVEMVDAAGNISPRSAAVCVSTVDAGRTPDGGSMPTPSAAAGGGCAVGAGQPGGPSPLPWLLCAALGVLVRRRDASV